MKVFLASLLLLSSTPTFASEPHPYLQKNLQTLRDREEQTHRSWRSPRPWTTASDSQARSKIYKSSISSWKNYEKHLSKYFNKLPD